MKLNTQEDILSAVCQTFGVTEDQMKNTKMRKYVCAMARTAYTQLLTQRLEMKPDDVGALINRHRVTVGRILEEHTMAYRMDDSYRDKFDTINGKRKTLECVLTVTETYDMVKKQRCYSRNQVRNHMLKLLLKKLIKDGMATVDVAVNGENDTTYIAKLNIPKSWME